jgi:hypothetical protein
MRNLGVTQHIPKYMVLEEPDYILNIKHRMTSELMEKVAFLIGENNHELKLTWFEREDMENWDMMILELSAEVGAVDHEYPRDKVYRHMPMYPLQAITDGKNHCNYCNADTLDDDRGNCSSCGAPRRKDCR